ncbi:MAG: ATP-dependent protease LonB [Candidatus Diapherotrites archaeon]|nr:ATP-dependent protease LonB [Candidatus Diapherotrites archaeon]
MVMKKEKIVKVEKVPYEGYVYNLTTDSGNYRANDILTKNSGGLGTPAHLRVIPGLIHQASGGVLFIDEIANLSAKSQQELLTAMQEKKYSITGQSEQSSGAMTITEPVPCDFLLVASGNYDALQHVHPALRSRIRGYGYEVYMNENIEDTLENRNKIARFVAQEVVKDKKIPPFTRTAVEKIVLESRRRAATKGKLTLKLRDLGGLVRTAGDVAKERKKDIVDVDEVVTAIVYAKSLERQMADEVLDLRKKYEVIKVKGSQIGRVNGLAVLGNSDAGLLLPVEAEVTPGGEVKEITATGGLGKIAQEAIKNVSAIVKKYFGKDLRGKHDIYVQFLQSTGGVEGDSASIAIATAVISAFLDIPVRQDVAMTGSLSVRGEVLPVGGVSFKLQAAYDAGIREIVIPEKNRDDIVVSEKVLKEMRIHSVSTLDEVLKVSLVNSKKKRDILKKMDNQLNGKKR